jgi:hypothetical protein
MLFFNLPYIFCDGGLHPGTDKRFIIPQNIRIGARAPPSLLFSGYRGLFLGMGEGGVLGHEADKLPPCSAEVIEWSYTSTPTICLHGVRRKNFTYSYMLYACHYP